MTVGKLKTLLAALPDDMEISVLLANDSMEAMPKDIVQVSRGRWLAEDADFDFDEEDSFVQDEENGSIAVIIPW